MGLDDVGLDDDGFAVFAELAAKSVGNFSHGGIGFNGGEDGGEQIFGGGGAASELRQSGLDLGAVAFCAKGMSWEIQSTPCYRHLFSVTGPVLSQRTG